MSVKASRFAWWRLKLGALMLLLLDCRAAAEAVLDEMLARWPDDPYALASRAQLKAQAGRRDDAIADAQRLVQVHPRRSGADWLRLASLLESADRLPEAELAFRQAVALDDTLQDAWYGLGLTLVRQQRFGEAMPALLRNTELQPRSPYGWYQLARVHLARRDPEAARRAIHRLQGVEPEAAAQLQRETGLEP
jgi:predicted Zn-dependent protease